MVDCAAVAKAKGYKIDVFIWNKSDLLGKSHQGGCRQASSSEYIVVVYKHAESTETSLSKHYALMTQKEALVSELWCISSFTLYNLIELNLVFTSVVFFCVYYEN